MATEKLKLDTKLQVVLDTGETKSGSAVMKTLSFSNVKNAATDDQLLAAGTALGGLCAYDLDSVKTTETYKLSAGE